MPFPEVKPNLKKVFLMNIITVVSIALVILLLIIMFSRIVGTEFFQEVAGGFGFDVEIELWHVILWFILAIVIVTLVILVINYFSLSNVRYEFQPEKIVYYRSLFFVLLNSKGIPYANIAKINFDYEGFLNSLFNTGKITIELTAMKEKEFKMEFIDNAEQVAKYIQKMIQDYRSRYYAQRTEEYKVDNIFKREGL